MMEHPDLKMMDVMQAVAKVWSEMTMDDKIPFINKSQEDRYRFQEESETFMRQRFDHSSNRMDPRMMRPQPAANKRPMTGYMIFAKTIRNNVKQAGHDLTVQELMRLIGREWAKLSMDEKYQYDI